MADYTKVKDGDPLRISADQFNSWQDAAAFAQSAGLKLNGRPAQGRQRNGTAIRVQNVSGSDVPAFNVLTLKEPFTVPTAGSAVDADDAATTTFTSAVVMTADTPADEKDSFCVLLEPLADQDIGWAIVSGVVPCRVNIANAADKYIAADPGETVAKSGDTGQPILWVAGDVGQATTTGEQWAYVMLGGGGAAKLPTGQYQYQFYGMGSQNQAAWMYQPAHGIV